MASVAMNLLYNIHRHYHCTQNDVCNYAFHIGIARGCSGWPAPQGRENKNHV